MVKIMEIRLPHYGRGYHLITQELLSRLPQLPENGLLNLFIKHTSAALTINETGFQPAGHIFTGRQYLPAPGAGRQIL